MFSVLSSLILWVGLKSNPPPSSLLYMLVSLVSSPLWNMNSQMGKQENCHWLWAMNSTPAQLYSLQSSHYQCIVDLSFFSGVFSLHRLTSFFHKGHPYFKSLCKTVSIVSKSLTMLIWCPCSHWQHVNHFSVVVDYADIDSLFWKPLTDFKGTISRKKVLKCFYISMINVLTSWKDWVYTYILNSLS